MSKTKWYTKALYLVFALALTIGLAGIPAVGAVEPPEPPEEVNTLRIYGQCTHDSDFPYTGESDPFDLTGSSITDKDFLVWNPAYMNHWDEDANRDYGLFFQKILVDSRDANEKVFLKQWYVPKYQEPRGCVWADLDPDEPTPDDPGDYVFSPDIVKEYTYLLLDTYNNPVAGKPREELTTFVFPIADNSTQIGLDSYDAVVGDGIPANETRLNYIWHEPDAFNQNDCPSWCAANTTKIDISTQKVTLFEGDVVQFLDHAAEVTSIEDGTVLLTVYYGGNDDDEDIAYPVLLRNGDVLSAGRHAVHVQEVAVVALDFADPDTWNYLRPVVEPWYLHLDTATVSGGAKVWAGRLLQEGETFFVDGAEYDVAKLQIEATGEDIPWALKYITLRNPLPKVEVHIAPLTITKTAVGPCPELIPLLPPFNMEHDIIDDVNIPEVVAEEEDGNPVSHADEQYPDNVDEVDDWSYNETAILPQDKGEPDGYGDDSGILIPYNTIAGRRVVDQDAAEECWVSEEKEERFDTNLLEEKFTESEELWQWINIETLPWDYTEFVLPEIEDVTDPTDGDDPVGDDDGDFILVSSWHAPNSAHYCPYDPVRVKFYFDAAVGKVNSADIYVNDADYNDQYRDGINANSLRVYGECTYDSEFPYLEFDDPFRIDKNPADPLNNPDGLTAKDFIVWNPAYMWHLDAASNGIYGHFFRRIVVNGNDANEKVFLKQWYVPKYAEPKGCTWDNVTGDYVSPDIVKEYTYLLLDTNNNPVIGLPKPAQTTFVFPIADKEDQIGLDSYDAVAYDGVLANETVLNRIWVNDANVTALLPDWCEPSPVEVIDISTADLLLGVGDFIEFLDHSAEVTGIHDGSIDVWIWYGGNDADAMIGEEMTVCTFSTDKDLLSAGRHHVHVQKDGLFDWTDPTTWQYLRLVTEPWYLQLIDASEGGDALVRVGRLMLEGETFFVDAAEYDVASLWIESGGLKYITLRNPLPKEQVNIEPLTIIKKPVGQCPDWIPFLPPFNMVHDIIDDINIPECVAGDPNYDVYADVQAPDNEIGEEDWCDDTEVTPPEEQTKGDSDGCGDKSWLDMDYNTVWERRVVDQDPAEECWIAEEKEERFDTSLMEEKFIGDDEDWQWINIETLPWDYTEFVLPEIDDITGSGDYILVSSFYAPNSEHVVRYGDAQGAGVNDSMIPVRVKFVYDAIDGTGLYVNTKPIPECPLQGDVNGDGNVNSGDITKLERIILTLDVETPCADVNGDGNINSGDITKVERIMLGLD